MGIVLHLSLRTALLYPLLKLFFSVCVRSILRLVLFKVFTPNLFPDSPNPFRRTPFRLILNSELPSHFKITRLYTLLSKRTLLEQ